MIITTRQPYELATTRRRCADGARRATDTLRRRYVVSQGAGRWLVQR